MKLQYVSIHGPAPLILLLTEAPREASQTERRYRQEFTDLLARYVAMRGFSYFVFRDSVGDAPVDSTPEATLERLETASRKVSAALAAAQVPPAAYLGLAEGAVVAARLVLLDSLPRRLVALAPSLPSRSAKGAPHWDEIARARCNGLPQLLAVQSLCDGPMPPALNTAGMKSQRLILVPNNDAWLAWMRDGSCPEKREVVEMLPSLNVAQMVSEWLGSSLPFPQ
jgi:hypothetical protein